MSGLSARRDEILEDNDVCRVVIDDVDHRMPRSPAVVGHAGAQDSRQGLAGLALGTKLEVREQGAEQVFWRARQQVFGVDPAEILAPKTFNHGPLFGRLLAAWSRDVGLDIAAQARAFAGPPPGGAQA